MAELGEQKSKTKNQKPKNEGKEGGVVDSLLVWLMFEFIVHRIVGGVSVSIQTSATLWVSSREYRVGWKSICLIPY